VETVVRCRGLRVEAGPAAGDSEWKHGCVAGWLGVETGMCCRGLRVEAGCAVGGSEWNQGCVVEGSEWKQGVLQGARNGSRGLM
jgi:hypothetical protein